MSCWRSSLARLHLFVTERTIHLHSMTVDFPNVTTDLMKHQFKQCCAVNGKWISDVLEDVGNVLFPFHLLPERRKMSPSYTQSPTMLSPRAPTQTIHLC